MNLKFREVKSTLAAITSVLPLIAAPLAWSDGSNTTSPAPTPATPTPVITQSPDLLLPFLGGCAQQYDLAIDLSTDAALVADFTATTAAGVVLGFNIAGAIADEVAQGLEVAAWGIGGVAMDAAAVSAAAAIATVVGIPLAIPLNTAGVAAGGVAMNAATVTTTAQAVATGLKLAGLVGETVNVAAGLTSNLISVETQVLSHYQHSLDNCDQNFTGTVTVKGGGLNVTGNSIFNNNVGIAANVDVEGNVIASQFFATQGISAVGGGIWIGDLNGTTYSDGITIGGGALSGAGIGGLQAFTGHVNAIALGNNAQSMLSGSLAIGLDSVSAGLDSIAIGSNAQATMDGSLALGLDSMSTGADAVAVGNNAQATTSGSLAIGLDSTSAGLDSIAIGTNAQATLDGSLALGLGSTSTGADAVAIGSNAQATSSGALAVGLDSASTGVDAIAIGHTSAANGDEDVVIGAQNNTDAGGNNTVVGNEIDIVGATSANNTVLGVGHQVEGSGNFVGGDPNTIVGSDNVVTGVNSNVTGDSNVAIGDTVTVEGNRAVAVGNGVTASADDTTAVGTNARAEATGSAAYGQGAVAVLEQQQVFGTVANTYTTPGLPSQLSRSRQVGRLEVATSDAAGNLATDGGQIYETLSENQAGIAIAMGMVNPSLTGEESFGVGINWGRFEGSQSLNLSVMGVISKDLFGGDERLSISGGYGVSLKEDRFGGHKTNGVNGGRIGLQLTW